jgi:hypothetical protein
VTVLTLVAVVAVLVCFDTRLNYSFIIHRSCLSVVLLRLQAMRTLVFSYCTLFRGLEKSPEAFVLKCLSPGHLKGVRMYFGFKEDNKSERREQGEQRPPNSSERHWFDRRI